MVRILIVIILLGSLVNLAYADFFGSHNIDTQSQSYHWAWNDIVGWINFHANQTVEVRSDELRGWAESNVGSVVFNCATTPGGNICGSSNFKVANNAGSLSGWAWNDSLGWISFDGVGYQVTIEPAGDGINSFFKGWAWSEIAGWISFHCDNHTPSLCSSDFYPTYKIQTSAGSFPSTGYLESNVFDTQRADPVYNYILWQGTLNGVANGVQFQIASSDLATGPWVFDSAVIASPNQKILIGASHQGRRYIKYKVLLSTDSFQQDTPFIDDIIINYGP